MPGIPFLQGGEDVKQCSGCKKWFTNDLVSSNVICPECGEKMGFVASPRWLGLMLELDRQDDLEKAMEEEIF
jgi:predicted RNA-binding Zn-ribbon protein involved in translation (DUF1610 family)